jgi:hypothetical protein
MNYLISSVVFKVRKIFGPKRMGEIIRTIARPRDIMMETDTQYPGRGLPDWIEAFHRGAQTNRGVGCNFARRGL